MAYGLESGRSSEVLVGGRLARALGERENKERRPRVILKGLNLCALIVQESKDGLRPSITNRQPYDLRRCAMEKTELSKVVILRDDHVSILPRPFPDRGICGAS